MIDGSPLEKELKFFADNEAKWAEHHLGKFALVKGDELVDTFDRAEIAVSEGVRLFGLEPFLVRPVALTEEEVFIPALALGLLDVHSA